MNKIKYFLALQAFQFDIFIYYSLATQFSLNWWCQSSISMNSGETKVDAIVFNSVKSGRKLEHWPPPLTMYNSGLVHLWLKNHAVILICFFPWERCWNPPMNCHCWGGCIVWANLCNKERIPLCFQAPNNDKLRGLHTLKHRFYFHFIKFQRSFSTHNFKCYSNFEYWFWIWYKWEVYS